MIVGIRDMRKLLGISVVMCCAVFVCALFLNYNADIAGIQDEITTPQGMVLYDAVVSSGKVVAAVTGGCLALTSLIMLLFYIKNYIDSHGKELGILKALGYSNLRVAVHFWVFGLSVLLGCAAGFMGAQAYLPSFYELQNEDHFFPEVPLRFHMELVLFLIALPALFFMLLSVLYAWSKMRSPVLNLLKEARKSSVRIRRRATGELPFLQELRRNTLRSRGILVFFVGFSAFCFAAMTQMSMSMKDLSSESMALMMLSIGLILAFMSLFLSLSSVMRANTKTIAMMKVFGYSQSECGRALLGGYRPVSWVGFAIGTVYQYALLKFMVSVVFAEYENMPEYGFDVKSCILSAVLFLLSYETVIACYARRIGRVPVKEIMVE